MLTRDHYVALLEKRAEMYDVHADPQSASHAPTAVPETDVGAAVAQDHKKVLEDGRQYLHTLFPNAGAVQENQTAHVKKLFELPHDTTTSNPLLKVARVTFFGAVQKTAFMKVAAPLHLETAYRSFCDELEKIAAIQAQTASQVAMKNRVAMSRPAKVWDVSSPGAAAASGAHPTLPQGSGTSVHTGGFLGRLGLK